MALFALDSLGCKLNQAEIEALGYELLSRGHELAASVEAADVYVLNTCTVTHVADRKSRHALRMARRRNSHALTVALGCYARRSPDELRLPGVADLVVSSRDSAEVADIIEERQAHSKKAASSRADSGRCRTRSSIKVQDGCSSFCSFCIVPHVRGKESSRPAEAIIQEAKARVLGGSKEIVLTGTKIGDYRWNGSESSGLPALVRRILEDTGVLRLRLSSLEPHHLTREMLDLWADRRLCPHLHIPLQSGTQSVLRRMNRPYSIDDYERAVEKANQAIPDLAITTDVMVGFPGETAEEFEESYRCCIRMGFAGIHVFSFSNRQGTAASVMPEQLDEKVKKERSARMLALAEASARTFKRRFTGRTMEVLWERRSGRETWDGLTGNYLRVFVHSSKELSGSLTPARLVSGHPQGLVGQLVHGGGNG